MIILCVLLGACVVGLGATVIRRNERRQLSREIAAKAAGQAVREVLDRLEVG